VGQRLGVFFLPLSNPCIEAEELASPQIQVWLTCGLEIFTILYIIKPSNTTYRDVSTYVLISLYVVLDSLIIYSVALTTQRNGTFENRNRNFFRSYAA
jgi:hypothetical protein